jgi:polyhydroxyalkanoate synthesis regulator protein
MEEVRRQNVAMMERALSLFTPFYRGPEADASGEPNDPQAQEVAALRAEVATLRRELAAAQAAAAKPVKT